jgi:hypothetical protein
MKKTIFTLAVGLITLAVSAQGAGQPNKPINTKPAKGVSYQSGNTPVKTSENIPDKVGESFSKDFPQAKDVTWTTSKGNWTANFKLSLARATATYHANGNRLNSSIRLKAGQLPENVWKQVQIRFPNSSKENEALRFERPGTPTQYKLYIKENGKMNTYIFDENGKVIK